MVTSPRRRRTGRGDDGLSRRRQGPSPRRRPRQGRRREAGPQRRRSHARRRDPRNGHPGQTGRKVLIEPGIDIAARSTWASSSTARAATALPDGSAPAGGVDIEEVAATTPEKILKLTSSRSLGLRAFQICRCGAFLGIPPPLTQPFGHDPRQALPGVHARKTARWPRSTRWSSPEPASSSRCDAKMVFDDNAPVPPPGAARHCATTARRSPSRSRPARAGVNYVKLDGSIGCIVNGAGLGDGHDGHCEALRRPARELPGHRRRGQGRTGDRSPCGSSPPTRVSTRFCSTSSAGSFAATAWPRAFSRRSSGSTRRIPIVSAWSARTRTRPAKCSRTHR